MKALEANVQAYKAKVGKKPGDTPLVRVLFEGIGGNAAGGAEQEQLDASDTQSKTHWWPVTKITHKKPTRPHPRQGRTDKMQIVGDGASEPGKPEGPEDLGALNNGTGKGNGTGELDCRQCGGKGRPRHSWHTPASNPSNITCTCCRRKGHHVSVCRPSTSQRGKEQAIHVTATTNGTQTDGTDKWSQRRTNKVVILPRQLPQYERVGQMNDVSETVGYYGLMGDGQQPGGGRSGYGRQQAA